MPDKTSVEPCRSHPPTNRIPRCGKRAESSALTPGSAADNAPGWLEAAAGAGRLNYKRLGRTTRDCVGVRREIAASPRAVRGVFFALNRSTVGGMAPRVERRSPLPAARAAFRSKQHREQCSDCPYPCAPRIPIGGFDGCPVGCLDLALWVVAITYKPGFRCSRPNHQRSGP
jgi:hypothetical protein